MIKTRAIQAGLLAATLVLAAACGSDDDDGGGSASTAGGAAPATSGGAATTGGTDTTAAETTEAGTDTTEAGADSTEGGTDTTEGADTTEATDTTEAGGTAGSDGSAAQPTETGTVKIGLLTPLSGRFGDYGAPFRDGVAYAVEQINGDGGFTVGDTQYTFELLVVDDRSDQAAAVQGATELMNDEGVVALFGPIGPLGPSVTQLTTAEGVLNFSSSSSVAAIAGPPDNPLTFITNGSAEGRVQAGVDSIVEFVPGAQKVAILGPDDETAAGIVPVFEEALGAAGMTPTVYSYPVGTTDLSTVITRMVADDPDVVILGWAQSDRANQGPQLAAAGLSEDVPVFLYADALETCLTVFAGRQCINHPLAGADLTSEDLEPTTQEFVDGFLAFTGASELPTQSAAILWTYDFPWILAQAMEQAGSVDDAEAIGQALHEVTRDGLIGELTFDEGNKAVFGFDITNVAADGTITTENFD